MLLRTKVFLAEPAKTPWTRKVQVALQLGRMLADLPTSDLAYGIPTTDGILFKRLRVTPHVQTLHSWCRNINLLSIVYAYQPRLRGRLTLGGIPFPRKP